MSENRCEVQYRAKKFNSIPDVSASVYRWAEQQGSSDDPPTLIPDFLHQLFQPRVTVFGLLASSLGQTFSLDNGLALQELLGYWLARHRKTKGKRQAGRDVGGLGTLKQHRQAHVLWWEARMVRHRVLSSALTSVHTWPREDEPLLVRMCTTLLETLGMVSEGSAPCAGEHILHGDLSDPRRGL